MNLSFQKILLIATIFYSALNFAQAQSLSTGGVELKTFIAGLVDVSLAPRPAQPEAFRDLISNHRPVVTKILNGKITEGLDLTELGVPTADAPFLNLKLKAYSSNRAVNWIAKGFVSVRKKIFGVGFILNAIQRLSDSKVYEILDRMDSWIDGIDPTQLPAFEKFTSSLKGPTQDNELFRLIRQALPTYIRNLPVDTKKRQLKALLSSSKPLAALVQNSGIVPQKMLQMAYSEIEPGELKDSVGEILSNVDPFPGEIAVEIIEAEMGQPIGEVFEYFEMKPIKAGTLGQIHRARFIGGRKCVIKVLKPNAREQMKLEFASMRIAAPGYEHILDGIEKSYTKQADYTLEAQETDQAQVEFRDISEGIQVSKRVEGRGPYLRILILDEVEGVPLIDLMKRDLSPGQLKSIGKKLMVLYQFWVEKGVYGSGSIHSDIHPGNTMGELVADDNVNLTLIDFADSNYIPPEIQKAMIGLAVGVIAMSPDLAEKSLHKLLDIPNSRKAMLAEALKRTIGNPSFSPEKRFKESLRAVSALKISIPDSLLDFARSQTMMLGAIQAINTRLGEDYFKPKAVYKTLAKRHWTSALNSEILLDSQVRKLMFGEVTGALETCLKLFGRTKPAEPQLPIEPVK